MSALARGASEEFARALREALEDIRSFGFGIARAGRGLGEFSGATFAASTAMLSAQRFVRDAAFGTIEDTLRHGTGHFGGAVRANALRAMSNIPFDPFQAGEIERPLEAAGSRLSGITGPIARAGGRVDVATKSALFDLLHAQEQRAELDAKENARLQNEKSSAEIERAGGGSGAFLGIPANPAAFFLRIFGLSMR
jgi:hypothetical protein